MYIRLRGIAARTRDREPRIALERTGIGPARGPAADVAARRRVRRTRTVGWLEVWRRFCCASHKAPEPSFFARGATSPRLIGRRGAGKLAGIRFGDCKPGASRVHYVNVDAGRVARMETPRRRACGGGKRGAVTSLESARLKTRGPPEGALAFIGAEEDAGHPCTVALEFSHSSATTPARSPGTSEMPTHGSFAVLFCTDTPFAVRDCAAIVFAARARWSRRSSRRGPRRHPRLRGRRPARRPPS